MRALIGSLLLLAGFGCRFLSAAVVLGTWNGKWFPSGRAEHRAEASAEAATIAAAGEMFRRGLAELDPQQTNDLVLCLNEIRDRETAEALCRTIGRADLAVVSASAYRRRDRFDQQQDMILTTLPVVAAGWSRWKSAKQETPPRGYVWSELVFPGAVTTMVYAVHLKSNYGQTTEFLAILNRAKRTHAIRQLTESERLYRRKRNRPVVIAGDFNADKWDDKFSRETIFADLSEAGFVNLLELLPKEARITHPGRGKWKGSALDYIMIRGFSEYRAPVIFAAGETSDHDLVLSLLP